MSLFPDYARLRAELVAGLLPLNRASARRTRLPLTHDSVAAGFSQPLDSPLAMDIADSLVVVHRTPSKGFEMSASSVSGLVARYMPAVAVAARPVGSRLGGTPRLGGVAARLQEIEASAQRLLIAHSIAILRVSMGAVFLAFGALKFFPGVSPAQGMVEQTTDILTLGLLPAGIALVLVAALECVIGLCLISGRALRGAVYLLGIQLIGILSPLVLLTAHLFDGPHGAPTLAGQYVLKDFILVGAALVIAATVGGGRLASRPDEHSAR